jgi:hypothetical protein
MSTGVKVQRRFTNMVLAIATRPPKGHAPRKRLAVRGVPSYAALARRFLWGRWRRSASRSSGTPGLGTAVLQFRPLGASHEVSEASQI